MGGNVKFYDEHIALSSPRKKIKTSSRSSKTLNQTMESSLNASPARSAMSENFGSMDMTPRVLSTPDKKGLELNESHGSSGGKKISNIIEHKKLDTSSQIHAALERLRINENATTHGSKANTTSSSIAESIAKVDSWKTDFDNCNSPSFLAEEGIEGVSSKTTNNVTNIYDAPVYQLQMSTSGNGARARDYSPIRSISASMDIPELRDDEKAGGQSKPFNHATEITKEGVVDEKDAVVNVVNSGTDGVNNSHEAKAGDIPDTERMSRYNRTLLYVNEQNETLQNGDYSELNVNLSDLSSDVFTDSEIPTSGFLSQSRDGKSDLDFYPDSPTTEQAFSKTPCSSRKNSLESCISDDSMSAVDLDFKAGVEKKVHKLVPNGDMRSTSHTAENGKTKELKGKNSTPSIKAKVPGEGVRKMGFKTKAKPKVNSFSNIGHVPGGGRVKVRTDKLKPPKHVDPRTDTHNVEAYSHLPTEFQEIAKRLAKQDRQLRESKISGSSSSGRGRTRSRRSSRGSSRAGSVSPDQRSTSKANFRLGSVSGSSMNLNTSTTSLAQNKGNLSSTRRAPISRSPSIRSRPTTPSLSRSHPATFATLYDSRSRPPSRPSSRPSSPVSQSRNSSPTNGRRSRGSSPASNRRKSSTLNHASSSTNRSKGKMANGIRGRPTNLVGLSSVEIGLSSGSVFQVIPVHK